MWDDVLYSGVSVMRCETELLLTNETAESSRQGCRKHSDSYKWRKDAGVLEF